jgi:hypothetical protein
LDKIGGASELVNILRSQLSSRAEALKTASGQSSETANAGASVPISIEELRKRLGREMRNLDLKLPENRRQARIIFIESVIAWDFGDGLLNDPNFSLFVRDVEKSMSSDPKVAQALDQLLQQLQNTP